MDQRSKTRSLFREIARFVAPPADLTVSEWADRYRMLSSEASAEPGPWRTSRAPYQREPMNAITDLRYETIVFKWSAQVGKTEAILNAIGYLPQSMIHLRSWRYIRPWKWPDPFQRIDWLPCIGILQN
ncbi:phage terminase large subunit family protein [Paenibacillus larvae]|uniref:phage terminase large subunit family protein n=1 Tax=Paenibacillus larvae TaxID=1464 RepID=UPI00288EDE60|nr:phage terminase large subunit family protein [Paenibacillus larvae]MDT2270058.1 phage terminase large subunit family protein [Paenibacillus larvae]